MNDRIAVWLGIGQLVCGLVAVVALVVAILAFSAKTDTIQTSRRDGRTDFCNVVKGLILAATTPDRRPAVQMYIGHTQLASCVVYGRQLSGPPHPPPPPPLPR